MDEENFNCNLKEIVEPIFEKIWHFLLWDFEC